MTLDGNPDYIGGEQYEKNRADRLQRDLDEELREENEELQTVVAKLREEVAALRREAGIE